MTMRRSASTPTLSGADEGLEVYVAQRPLACKLPHVPAALQNGLLRDIGCAHYYTVIRQPSDGTLRSLDFGPVGGRDIAFTPARQSLWEWGRKRLSRAPPPPKGTPGEVREMMLTEMPASCMFVGRTKLSLGDIRSFNSLQNNLYLLHKSDCRHYVNNLVQYATGIQGITRKATREIYTAQREVLAWTDRLILLTHNITDVGQWPRVQRATQTALAVLSAFGGRRYATQIAMKLGRSPAFAVGAPVWRRVPQRIVAARAPAFAAAGSSTGLALSGVAPRVLPLPRVARAATAAGAATLAASQAQASLLASLGDGLKSTGAMLRAVSARAGSAAVAAGAAGAMRLRAPQQVKARPRPSPSRAPPSHASRQRQSGILVLGTAC